MSLAISEEAIEARGVSPFWNATELLGGVPLSLSPPETVMWTTSIGEYFGAWRVPWMKPREWLVLSGTRSNGADYAIAVRPEDGDCERLRAVLRQAGVGEA